MGESIGVTAFARWRSLGLAMISDSEIRRVLEGQPLGRMRLFASLLGWNGLQLEHVRLPEGSVAVDGNVGVLVYYMTTDPKFNLQINVHPSGQARHYHATVKAERYRITNVGWHDFELTDDNQSLLAEAEQLKPWLYRPQFKNREWCREFIKAHPKMAFPDLKRRGKR